MWATGNLANRTWVYVLSFAVLFWIGAGFGLSWFAIATGTPWSQVLKMIVLFLYFAYLSWQALQQRRERGLAQKGRLR